MALDAVVVDVEDWAFSAAVSLVVAAATCLVRTSERALTVAADWALRYSR